MSDYDAFAVALPDPHNGSALCQQLLVQPELLARIVGRGVHPGKFHRAAVHDTHAIMRHATRMPAYLDCAATTPIDRRVRDEVLRYLEVEFGNPGSRTHDFGRRARTAVEAARDRVAT